ncbi:MAG: TadE/TadG family type IV pilus assembly protein [Acidobacteriaceae bacterium]|nr:TadE/TadG family type IV pilus assembly protein [Acidobacteriaceae bacterium]
MQHANRRSVARSDEGNTTIEFAASAMVILLSMIGIMEISRAMYVNHFVANAAREGMRYAIVRGSGWQGTACAAASSPSCTASSSDVSKYVLSTVTPGIDPTQLVITASWPGIGADGTACDTSNGNNSAGCAVSVTVTYPYTILLPIPTRTFPMSSTTTGTVSF